jgi:DNA-binding PadR family transcriptional regulator
LEAEVLKEFRERFVRSFIDILILAELKKRSPMSGYDVITFIHKKFHLLMSSGTVYTILYGLERRGLIKSIQTSRKRVYKLTDKGVETINIIRKGKERIQSLMTKLFK